MIIKKIDKIRGIKHITILSIILLIVSVGLYFQQISRENNAICERIILDSSFAGKDKKDLTSEELNLLNLKKRTCFNGR